MAFFPLQLTTLHIYPEDATTESDFNNSKGQWSSLPKHLTDFRISVSKMILDASATVCLPRSIQTLYLNSMEIMKGLDVDAMRRMPPTLTRLSMPGAYLDEELIKALPPSLLHLKVNINPNALEKDILPRSIRTVLNGFESNEIIHPFPASVTSIPSISLSYRNIAKLWPISEPFTSEIRKYNLIQLSIVIREIGDDNILPSLPSSIKYLSISSSNGYCNLSCLPRMVETISLNISSINAGTPAHEWLSDLPFKRLTSLCIIGLKVPHSYLSYFKNLPCIEKLTFTFSDTMNAVLSHIPCTLKSINVSAYPPLKWETIIPDLPPKLTNLAAHIINDHTSTGMYKPILEMDHIQTFPISIEIFDVPRSYSPSKDPKVKKWIDRHAPALERPISIMGLQIPF
jgi:hypothetical protein